MRVVLQIVSEPWAGRKTWLRSGQLLEVGRSEQADVAVPHDGYMSGFHFAVQCDASACRLRDLGSSGGTFLNDQQVTEALLEHGDRITAGKTVFQVEIEGADATRQGRQSPASAPASSAHSIAAPASKWPVLQPEAELASHRPAGTPVPSETPPPVQPIPSPPRSDNRRQHSRSSGKAAIRPAAPPPGNSYAVGRWIFRGVPDGWVPLGEHGLRLAQPTFTHSIVLVEKPLDTGQQFDDHVAEVAQQIPASLKDSRVDGPEEAEIAGAERAAELTVVHAPADYLHLIQRQVLAQVGSQITTITLTTLASDFAALNPVFQQLMCGLVLDAGRGETTRPKN